MHQAFELSGQGRLARAISAVTMVSLASVAAPSRAAEGTIEEVVVTVQRRAESLSEVPIAVTALSGDFIQKVNLDDVKDLVSFTPGVTGNSKDSFIDALDIRGVVTNDFGVGGDPSISIFKNDLYQGRNGAVVTSLYDIERAEVLRGPQSFLFGRNSIAGAISIHTRRPDFDGVNGYVQVDAGQREHRVVEGAVNLPVSDTVAGRLALYSSHEDGYVKNLFNPSGDKLIKHDKQAGRLSLRYKTEATDVNFMAEYEDRDQSGSMYRPTQKGESWQTLQDIFGVTIGGKGTDVSSDFGLGERDNGKIRSLGLDVEHDFGFATLTSTTGYKSHHYRYAEDFDATPLAINDYLQDQDGTYFEQELRLVSNGAEAFSWYAGVSYYHENIDALFIQHASEDVMCQYYSHLYYGTAYTCSEYYYGNFNYDPNGLVESNRVKGNYQGWAAYVDLSYAFTDTVDASLGLRYTWDRKNFKLDALPVASELGPYFALGFTTDGYLEDTQSWDAVTPRVQVRYRPNDDWMYYASVTTGYKSGGFGSFSIFPDQPYGTTDVTRAMARPDSFDPERVVSYEIGTKGEFADRRARLELVGYYYTYEDLQVTVPGQGGGILVKNIGKVDGWGVETSLDTILTTFADLNLTGAWADTKARKVQDACGGLSICEGNSLPELPKWSWSAVLDLHAPASAGQWLGRLEWFGQSSTEGGLEHSSAGAQDGWSELAVRAGYESNAGWRVLGYVENVNDELYYDGSGPGSGIIPAHYFGPSRPRTFGVMLSWEFD